MILNPVLHELNKALEQHGVRLCEACGELYPLDTDHFYRQNNKAHYRFVCIACVRKREAEYRRAHHSDPEWMEKRREAVHKHYWGHRKIELNLRLPRETHRIRVRRAAFERILAGVERKVS